MCPFLTIAYSHLTRCIQEECAFYNRRAERCTIKVIAQVLEKYFKS